MANLASGSVTFLFTDIEGSTKLAQQHPDAMPALLARHQEILNQAIETQGGYVFQIVGDPSPPVEQVSIERDLSIIRTKVTEAEFANSSAEGSTITTEQAIALALEEM